MSLKNELDGSDSEEENDLRLRRELGRRLAVLRCRREWSQRELARRVGATRGRVAKWELGLSVPSLSMLAALSRVLEVTPNELLVLEPERVGGIRLTSAQKERVDEAVRTLLGFLEESMPNGRKR